MTDSSSASVQPGAAKSDAGDLARPACAVLCSAGLDSAVLVAHQAQTATVVPVYVRVGLAWEEAERATLDALLASPTFAPAVEPLVVLDLDMRDVYPPTHWAIRGAAPAYDTPDEDVYIVGRNVVLLTKAAIACAYRGIGRIAIGPLAGNPFPDATPAFFAAIGGALSLGLAHGITVEAPFGSWEKSAVIARGIELGVPLDRTLSCMSPARVDGAWRHCGQCSKCRERRDAFADARVDDPTAYAAASPR
ncbi:MAG: 7-cyano-7-deazaguanine synthase [Vicinamibacteraceae bacterium]